MSLPKNSQNFELDKKRHSLAHLMAAAAWQMFPEAQFGVGPVIENGCYYDFILPRTLIPEDLPLIEEKMRGFLKRNLAYKVQTLSLEEAVELFENRGQKLKVELLLDLKNKGTTKLDESEAEIFETNSQFPTQSDSLPGSNQAQSAVDAGSVLKGVGVSSKAYIVEKSLPSDKFSELSYFGAVQIDKEKEEWGKLIYLYYAPNKEAELIQFLQDNLLSKNDDQEAAATSWYSEVGSKVVFPGKVIDVATDEGFLEFVEYGRKLGISEEQLDAVSARESLTDEADGAGGNTSAFGHSSLKEEIQAGGTPKITVYRIIDEDMGEMLFEDLCKGPHVEHVRELGDLGFKLDKFSGAYWRGDQERDIQMQRIYALVFDTQPEFDEFLNQREEAKKLDHRLLGEQMDIFAFSELIGPGLPLWLPKGRTLQILLEKLAEQEEKKQGYSPVATPLITKENLFYTSGHLPHYRDSMYSAMDIDGENYFIKPMNCPFHHQLYAARNRSYKELPLRFSEYGFCHRYEDSGSLFGLMRVRSMKMNDAHIYCTREQAVDEFIKSIDLIKTYFELLNITDYWFELALRNPDNDKYHDDEEMWETAEKMSLDALQKAGVKYIVEKDGAAFYGPKIDIQMRSSIGKIFTASTSQIDLYMPQRFGLKYVDSDGQEKIPVCIHRAPLSTHERMIGFLIEHFGGRFPLWLAPVQVKILTVNDSVSEYVEKVKDILNDVVLMKPLKYNEIRYEVDDRSESLGKKIREAEVQKIPVILIVGPKDVEAGQVSVRTQDGESKVSLEELKGLLEGNIVNKTNL
jgi:threonyl-tRNA synthetase